MRTRFRHFESWTSHLPETEILCEGRANRTMTEIERARQGRPTNQLPQERRIPAPRGTRDRFPAEQKRLEAIQQQLLHEFANSGFEKLSTPVLEFTELHERKSGAAIVSRLVELADDREGRLCLRPELTAGVVRAYAAQDHTVEVPWRVSVAGPVFRSGPVRPGVDRQFQQVGVELLGGPGPVADAEIISLADRSTRALGLPGPTIRIGHVGLILEILERSGLPKAAQSSLVEILSEAASEGADIRAVDRSLNQLSNWLGTESDDEGQAGPYDGHGPTPEIARLFDHLVPNVAGRRTGPEIMQRIYRKWELRRSLREALARIHSQVEAIAKLRGPAARVLVQLESQFQEMVPAAVAELRLLVALLQESGTDPSRIELDLGFGRGIGFYSEMVFELTVPTAEGPIEIGGGGRYDGLSRVFGSGQDDRGVGFAFGVERLDRAMGLLKVSIPGGRATTGGCLVMAPGPYVAEAARLVVDLRLAGRGVWEDGGPIIGPEQVEGECEGAIRQAQTRAERLGVSTLIVVGGRRIDTQSVRWFQSQERGWAELPAAPPIFLASQKTVAEGGQV